MDRRSSSKAPSVRYSIREGGIFSELEALRDGGTASFSGRFRENDPNLRDEVDDLSFRISAWEDDNGEGTTYQFLANAAVADRDPMLDEDYDAFVGGELSKWDWNLVPAEGPFLNITTRIVRFIRPGRETGDLADEFYDVLNGYCEIISDALQRAGYKGDYEIIFERPRKLVDNPPPPDPPKQEAPRRQAQEQKQLPIPVSTFEVFMIPDVRQLTLPLEGKKVFYSGPPLLAEYSLAGNGFSAELLGAADGPISDITVSAKRIGKEVAATAYLTPAQQHSLDRIADSRVDRNVPLAFEPDGRLVVRASGRDVSSSLFRLYKDLSNLLSPAYSPGINRAAFIPLYGTNADCFVLEDTIAEIIGQRTDYRMRKGPANI